MRVPCSQVSKISIFRQMVAFSPPARRIWMSEGVLKTRASAPRSGPCGFCGKARLSGPTVRPHLSRFQPLSRRTLCVKLVLAPHFHFHIRKNILHRYASVNRRVMDRTPANLLQPSIELLHRDMHRLSTSTQPWNLPQECRQHTPDVPIDVYGAVTEIV